MPRHKKTPSKTSTCLCESKTQTRKNPEKPKATKDGQVAKQRDNPKLPNYRKEKKNEKLRKDLSCSPINVPFMKFLEPLNKKVSSSCSVATLSPPNNLPKECVHLMENASFFLSQNNLNHNVGFTAYPERKRSNSKKRCSTKASKRNNNAKCNCTPIPAASTNNKCKCTPIPAASANDKCNCTPIPAASTSALPDFLRSPTKNVNVTKSDTGVANARLKSSTNGKSAGPTKDANKESCTNYLAAVCDHLLESVQNSVSSIIEQHYCKSLDKLDELHNRLSKNEETLCQMDNGFKEKIAEQSDKFLQHCHAILEIVKQNEANRQERAAQCRKPSTTSLTCMTECRSRHYDPWETQIKKNKCLPKYYECSPVPERPFVRREKLHILTGEPNWQSNNCNPYLNGPRAYVHKRAAQPRPMAVNILNVGGGSEGGGAGVGSGVGSDVAGVTGCANKVNNHVRGNMASSGNAYVPVNARFKCCCGHGERLMTSSICDKYNKCPDRMEQNKVFYSKNEQSIPSMPPHPPYGNIKYFAPSTSRPFQNAIPMRFVQVVGNDEDDMYLLDDGRCKYSEDYDDDSAHDLANYDDRSTGWWQP